MRTKLALFVAIVLGLVAGLGLYNFARRQKEAVEKKQRPTYVVAAKKFIERGKPIKPDMLTRVEIPEKAVTSEHILATPSETAKLFSQPLNQRVERGQLIQRHFLRTQARQLDDGLAEKERALTVAVDNVTGVGGNVRPMSRVDIFGTFTFRGAQKGSSADTQTILLLSDVKVVAVDNRTHRGVSPYSPLGRAGRTGYSTVTLNVTPQEAQVLIFAQSQGVVTLVLRGAKTGGKKASGETYGDILNPINLEGLPGRAQAVERARRDRRKSASVLPEK